MKGGSFRSSPPPLHRRLSTPSSADRRGVAGGDKNEIGKRGGGVSASPGAKHGKKHGKQHQKNQQQLQQQNVRLKQRHGVLPGAGRAAVEWEDDGVGGGEDGEEDEDESRTPPLPPSLFDSVFKNKLPSLTPRKAVPVTPRYARVRICCSTL